jgi:hypothetical protein
LRNDVTDTRDLVLTCLFTTTEDVQRGIKWDSNPKILAKLLLSLRAHGVDWMVFHDDPVVDPRHDWPQSGSGGVSREQLNSWHGWQLIERTVDDPYIERWVAYRRYLHDHPEVRLVWCVDGSDVELLQDPFNEIAPGVLYCGFEDEICGMEWMLRNHEASREWLEANATRTLLNPGVVGGDRKTVIQLCDYIVAAYHEAQDSGQSDRAGDMGYFQRAAYLMKHQTGPRIVTAYKRFERNNHSLFMHK